MTVPPLYDELAEVVSGVKLTFRSHCPTVFATERGVVASLKMLPAGPRVKPEGEDEDTDELGSA